MRAIASDLMHVIKTRTNSVATTSPAETLAPPDGWLARIRKLVPAEVIAGYAIVAAFDVRVALPIAIIAGALAIVYMLRRGSLDRDPPPLQYIFSLAAFWAWVLAIHDPLGVTPPTVAAIACIVLPVLGSYFIDLVEN
ncbi:MAG: hypothetical protein ABI704_08530 [Kofleriaceae bacterium]